ncbi:hypothetical protein Micbo1qcDRAFT_173550 [Microdochium bolleyi]|uniref:Transcription regulator Rua1 C-terminal domain-containing protein n=1 Tax=Microdochium bolleyi TaxID=196109 RepID=A0A136JC96_9PEZI|nr:hypothetical protein Micbo1qcDRAFT_173550 [Microdochium bolleyi]
MAAVEVHTPQTRPLKLDLASDLSRSTPVQPPPMIVMNGGEGTLEEPLSAHSTSWTTPISHAQHSSSTIHDGFSFCEGELYSSIPSWDSPSALHAQTPSDTMSRPTSMHQDLYSMTTSYDHNHWLMKPCEDSMEMHSFDNDLNIGQAYTTDEAIPILDLRYDNSHPDQISNPYESATKPRRMSGSSFTTGAMSEITSYDDFSAAMSEATPSLASDYPPLSNRNSLMSSSQLSPVASPRMTPYGRTDLVRTHSRGRATSPSPRPCVRSAPYNLDSAARNKRWSTGNYGTNANASRRPTPFVYNQTHDMFGNRMASNHQSPTISSHPLPLSYNNLQAVQHNHPCLTSNGPPSSFRNSMILPSQLPSQLPPQSFNAEALQHFDTPAPMLSSHGLFRMLQSNADPHALHSHYADLSDPPDLYACLGEEQLDPPPEDMNPEDPEMIPHEQELRFEGDLYTPKWVRGHGNKREGWCGICKPGRWLVLKNSAYWYDKSFSHGISAATGHPFQEPQERRRMDGNPDVWEGLCGSCNDWIALVSSKKKGTTWFRHAYKCHAHPKAKDGPKRRREASSGTPTRSKADSSPLTPTEPVHMPLSGTMAMLPTSIPAMPTIPSHLLQAHYMHPGSPYQPLDGMQNMI